MSLKNVGLSVGPVRRITHVSLMEGALPAYLKDMVEGVTAHLEELDVFIVRYSEHWRLERMTIVDRNLLRLAIYELLYQPNIPVKVVINEAVETGQALRQRGLRGVCQRHPGPGADVRGAEGLTGSGRD